MNRNVYQNLGAMPIVCRIIKTAGLAGAPKVYLAHPAEVINPEQEGVATALAVDGSAAIPVMILGNREPAADQDVIAIPLGGRWAAAHAISGPDMESYPDVTLSGCLCNPVPPILDMIASNPSLNNGMFQNCTLRYITPPSVYAPLAMGDKAFISDESFVDDSGNTFRYHFWCFFGEFRISRIYVTSTFGSPFEDSIRYTWGLNQAGNTCHPFALTAGVVYPGGDPASDVDILDGTP